MSKANAIKIKDLFDLAPQMKKMKLNSYPNREKEYSLKNYEITDPFENIKYAFPTISDKVIKEIVEKSENNLQEARTLIKDFKKNKQGNNKINNNRKRRHETAFAKEDNKITEECQKDEKNNSNIINTENLSDLNKKFEDENLIHQKNNLIPIKKNNSEISDFLLDNIISEIKNIKEEKNLKSYLKERIKNIIESKNEENSQRFCEIEKKLESCEKENYKLKKVISILYEKTIVIFF